MNFIWTTMFIWTNTFHMNYIWTKVFIWTKYVHMNYIWTKMFIWPTYELICSYELNIWTTYELRFSYELKMFIWTTYGRVFPATTFFCCRMYFCQFWGSLFRSFLINITKNLFWSTVPPSLFCQTFCLDILFSTI